MSARSGRLMDPPEKADLLHAIYEPITVAAPDRG
jgi:hypothetical protein